MTLLYCLNCANKSAAIISAPPTGPSAEAGDGGVGGGGAEEAAGGGVAAGGGGGGEPGLPPGGGPHLSHPHLTLRLPTHHQEEPPHQVTSSPPHLRPGKDASAARGKFSESGEMLGENHTQLFAKY